MSTKISSHKVVSETITVEANHHTGTEWVTIKWRDVEGARSDITFHLADDDARSALQQLATQILNATVEFEVSRELGSNQ
jgi:hypothetical protein